MATQPQGLRTGDPNLDSLSLQDWHRLRQILFDLTDPEMYGFEVKDPEIRRRALELLAIFK